MAARSDKRGRWREKERDIGGGEITPFFIQFPSYKESERGKREIKERKEKKEKKRCM